MSSLVDYEVVIIGAGAVGLAIAKELQENQCKSVIVLEKNSNFGQETSSRNSQVIHSGIFNDINSKKFQFCIEGKNLLYSFLRKYNLEFEQTEKIIVSKDSENEAFNKFVNEITKKGISFSKISKKELSKIEPNVKSSNSLIIHDSGIFDAHMYMHQLYQIANLSHDFLFNAKVSDIKFSDSYFTTNIVEGSGNKSKIKSKFLINCAGLESFNLSKRLMRNSLSIPNLRFFKGSYFKLSSVYRNQFKKLIYSLPSNEDSLGIHISFDEQKIPRLGPDYNEVFLKDGVFDYSVKYDSATSFFESAKDYIKNLNEEDLSADFSGIRPKLFVNGNSKSEFYIKEESDNGFPGLINLIGIDSPGLTSSLAIGRSVKNIMLNNLTVDE
tara:strand:- start:3244 stop:4392 length:1149 start_codon:yes stop_codon:yes gene_type:complete